MSLLSLSLKETLLDLDPSNTSRKRERSRSQKFVVLLNVTKSVQTHQKAAVTKLSVRSLQLAVLQHLIQVVALLLQTKVTLRLTKVSLN